MRSFVHARPFSQTLDTRTRMLPLQAAAYRRACGLGRAAHRGRPRAALELRVDLAQARLAVLQLGALLAAHHHDARRHVPHAHGGVCRIDALTAGAGGVEGLHGALGSQRAPVKPGKAGIA